MDRTSNRGRPRGSRGGRGKGKRGRKPKVVVSDEEVETNQQEEVEVATNKSPENDNANEKTKASEAVVIDEPMETVEVISFRDKFVFFQNVLVKFLSDAMFSPPSPPPHVLFDDGRFCVYFHHFLLFTVN